MAEVAQSAARYRDQLEKGETHDELWNAAQLQMVHHGKMHGFMRMYWAKKVRSQLFREGSLAKACLVLPKHPSAMLYCFNPSA